MVDTSNVLEDLFGESPKGENQPIDRSFIARWKHSDVFDSGFVPIPDRFLQLYSFLKPHPLTTSEALFVMQVMSFKWSAKAPFPSYARLAGRMGVTDKAVRRIAKSLETKGYLNRISRQGTTNRFDLNPLFDALLQAQKKQKAREKKDDE